MFCSAPGPLAWTAVTLDGYAWIALKNPKQFPSTLFWISNGGRHYEPWNGRHKRRIGIEDACSYFHEGVESSRSKSLPQNIPTVLAITSPTPSLSWEINKGSVF